MRVRVRLLDSVVAIETEDEQAAALVSALWSSMATDDASAPARVYTLARDRDGGWIATAGDEIEASHQSLWGVTDALRYRMLELCEERLVNFVTLHAAAVARGNDLVLLAGESGAGKTTLTLALLDAGWTYLSDDLAPVDPATALVHPFPKPLGVKDPAVWERVRAVFRDGPGLPPPDGSFLVPPRLWDVATEPLPARLLLFPRFDAGAELEVEPLTPARAAALASAYLRRLDPPRLALLNRLCAGARSVRLGYGSSGDAVRAIDSLLRGAP